MDHSHSVHEINNRLKISVILNAVIIAVQVIGGLIANSLSLLSDAGHNFTDLAALLLSWFAISQTLKPPTHRKTFGYHRTGVIAALGNSALLILMTGVIFYEAYHRLLNPEPVLGGLTLAVAGVGFIANMITAWILHAPSKENIAVKSGYLHMLGDALVSLGVMIAAILIMLTGSFIIDPIISFIIGVVIAYGAWQIIEESVHILLEGTPHGISVEKVIAAIVDIKGVRDIHDIHIWSLGSHVYAMNCHILVEDMKVSESVRILDDINAVLLHDFGISHTTIQFESDFCETNYLYCDLVNTEKIPKEVHHH